MFNIRLETFADMKGIGMFANSKDYYFVKQNIDRKMISMIMCMIMSEWLRDCC